MALTFYGHPFSSYCQKVQIALYENGTPFTYRTLGPDDPEAGARFEALSPLKKMPVLEDDGQVIVESSVIVEHLMLRHPGPVRFLPEDSSLALEVRKLDRFFDFYVMTPMQKIVGDFMRAEKDRDPFGVGEAKRLLERAYRWLDGAMAGRLWAAGDRFSLADCAAAPALLYADWVNEIGADLPNARAYRARLLARPSVMRCVDEARPFRRLFPPGAPDRD